MSIVRAFPNREPAWEEQFQTKAVLKEVRFSSPIDRGRGEREVLGPSQSAVEVDYQRLVVLERLDKSEARHSSDHDRRRKGIGNTQVLPADAGGSDARHWTP